MKRNLSKSKYTAFRQCPKILWMKTVSGRNWKKSVREMIDRPMAFTDLIFGT